MKFITQVYLFFFVFFTECMCDVIFVANVTTYTKKKNSCNFTQKKAKEIST